MRYLVDNKVGHQVRDANVYHIPYTVYGLIGRNERSLFLLISIINNCQLSNHRTVLSYALFFPLCKPTNQTSKIRVPNLMPLSL